AGARHGAGGRRREPRRRARRGRRPGDARLSQRRAGGPAPRSRAGARAPRIDGHHRRQRALPAWPAGGRRAVADAPRVALRPMTWPRVVCLVGPTASGKTALAVELAEALNAEIVSADSRQIYRRLDVGTAKPTPAERRRVPHHCLDLVDPEEPFDAARF